MAVVQNIKEKVHLPIYDCVNVEPEKQLRSIETSGTLKFFTNVQGKTKLETNLQSASLLPHYNTFEARAMRVVISDLPPKFPEEPRSGDDGFDVLRDDPGNAQNQIPVQVDTSGSPVTPPTPGAAVTADLDLSLDVIIDKLREARDSDTGIAELSVTDDGVTLSAPGVTGDIDADAIEDLGGTIEVSVGDLEGMLEDVPERNRPLEEQIDRNNGAGTLLSKLIYNTVTSLYVGEKLMIEMPTWFFPAGAGPYSEAGKFVTHGQPSPLATFKFAEPIFIDKQQNFRVEIEVPDADTLREVQRIYGPFFIWVVLDGYMTRDVQ